MLYFVDFEASSLLPGSFPIEVAWVDRDGRTEQYLIRPHPHWLEGGCIGWDAGSEAVHGISLETLLRDGTPIEHVAARAMEVLSAPGVVAFSDQPGWDGQWLDTMLDYGGVPGRTSLFDVVEAYREACRPLLGLIPSSEAAAGGKTREEVGRLATEIIVRARQTEALRSRVRHRAAEDAQGLWRIWRCVGEQVAQQMRGKG